MGPAGVSAKKGGRLGHGVGLALYMRWERKRGQTGNYADWGGHHHHYDGGKGGLPPIQAPF